MNEIRFNGNLLITSKVVCIGRNYLAHIEELDNDVPDEPVIFVKPNSSISDSLLAHERDEIHYEGELCFLVEHGEIVGLGFGLDLTKRALQKKLKEKGLPWERAKAFDNAVVFSDFVSVPECLEDLSMVLSINNRVVQEGHYSLMINKPAQLLANISEFMTLFDNDIVMTGTPSGVGKIEKGQVFKGEIFNQGTCLVSKQWTVL